MATYAPPPPWLHPQDTVGPYVQGLHLGAQLQQERQRLSQQANEAAVRASLQQQQIEQESMQAQQRLEVQRAQQQQELALKKQELEQQQQKIQMATQAAAQKYSEMQAYRQEMAEPGADPIKVGLRHPGVIGPTATGALMRGTMAQQRQPGGLPNVPVMKLGTSQDEFAMFPSATGSGYHPVRLGAQSQISDREMRKLQISMDDKELQGREKAHMQERNADRANLPPEEVKPEFKAGVAAWKEQDRILKAERKALRDRVKALGAGSTPQGTVPPRGERETGVTYNTPKGPHIWTGSGWKPAPAPADTGDNEEPDMEAE